MSTKIQQLTSFASDRAFSSPAFFLYSFRCESARAFSSSAFYLSDSRNASDRAFSCWRWAVASYKFNYLNISVLILAAFSCYFCKFWLHFFNILVQQIFEFGYIFCNNLGNYDSLFVLIVGAFSYKLWLHFRSNFVNLMLLFRFNFSSFGCIFF